MEGKQNWKHWICFLVAVSIVQVLFSQLADKLFLLLDLFAIIYCQMFFKYCLKNKLISFLFLKVKSPVQFYYKTFCKPFANAQTSQLTMMARG